MMHASVISCGVDYYSGGVGIDSPNRDQSMELAMEILFDLHKQGGRLETYRRLGYEGSYCIGAFYGEREQDTLWQFPGAAAHEAFIALGPFQERCSRIDVQITARQEPFDPQMTEQMYDYFRTLGTKGNGPRARQYDLYRNSKGGSTLYIGSQQSDWYICIYNKGAQSDDPKYKDCWRYEVRYKNRHALQISKALSRNVNQLSEATYSHMGNLLRKHGGGGR